MKKVYYDCEFLEGKQSKRFLGFKIAQTKPTIDLISIGMADDEGNEYYSISKDFNLKEAWNRYDIKTQKVYGDQRNVFPNGKKTKIYWIRENVLKPIFIDLATRHNKKNLSSGFSYALIAMEDFSYKSLKSLINMYGKSNEQIKEEVHDFCLDALVEMMMGPCNKVELYGYYSAYDHVALCWLFGKMIDLPEGFPMYTVDLKQIMDEVIMKPGGHVNCWFAPHKHTLEEGIEYVKKMHFYPQQENEHSALHDARWNKQLHGFLKAL